MSGFECRSEVSNLRNGVSPLLVGLVAGLLALFLSGCGTFGSGESDAVRAQRRTIALEALGQIGRPYRYGGASPSGFDCSGLVQYSYLQAGVKLPRTTGQQLKAGNTIALDDAEPGDLLFYRFSSRRGKVDHVAIYVGDGEAVHAPASGRQVIVADVDEPEWSRRFVRAVRVLR
jgi:murein DD-endopeptidase